MAGKMVKLSESEKEELQKRDIVIYLRSDEAKLIASGVLPTRVVEDVRYALDDRQSYIDGREKYVGPN